MFSPADLLVLGITILVLAVLRQMDRANRSIEKVKRYADRVKKDLDEIVESKKIEISDRAADMELREQAVLKVLETIEALEGQIHTRSEALGQFSDRLKQHETQVETLRKLDVRMQERFESFKDQTAQLTLVEKRLAKFQEKASLLGKSLQAIQGEFSRANRESLSEIESKILSDVGQRVAQLEESLVRTTEGVDRVQELSKTLQRDQETSITERLRTYEASFEELEISHQERIQEMAERTRELEGTLSAEIERDVEERFKGVEEGWMQRFSLLRREMEEVEKCAQETLTSQRDQETNMTERLRFYEASFEELETSHQKRIQEMAEQTRELEGTLSAEIERDVEERFKGVEKGWMQRFSLLRREMEEVEKCAQETLTSQRDQETSMTERLRSYEASFEELETSHQERIQEMTKRTREFEGTLSAEIEKDVEERFKGVEKGWMQRFSLLRKEMEEVEERAQETLSKGDDRWQEHQRESQGRSEELFRELEEDWLEKLSLLREEIAEVEKHARETAERENQCWRERQEGLKKRSEKFLIEIEESWSQRASSLKEEMRHVQERVQQTLTTADQHWQKRQGEFESHSEDFLQKLRSQTESEWKEQLEEIKGRILDERRASEEELAHLEAIFDKSKQLSQEIRTQLLGKAEQMQLEIYGEVETHFSEVRLGWEDRLQGVKERLETVESSLDRAQQLVTETINEGKLKLSEDLSQGQRELEETLSYYRSTSQQDLRELKEEIDELSSHAQTLRDQLTQRSSVLEDELLQRVEERLCGYETLIDKRLESVGQLAQEVETLESQMKKDVDRSLASAQEETALQVSQWSRERKERETQMEKRVIGLFSQVDELDQEIQRLKGEAYEAASHKLHHREEEFFSDLKRRETTMAQKLEDWISTTDEKMEEINQRLEKEKREITLRYKEAWQETTDQWQQESRDLFDQLKRRWQGFQVDVEERIAEREKNFKEYQQGVDTALDESKQSTEEFVKRGLETVRELLERQVRLANKEIESEGANLSLSFETARKELMGEIEKLRSEVTVWRSRTSQQINESEAQTADSLNILQTKLQEGINAQQEEFHGGREEWILLLNESRGEVKNELTLLGGQIQQLQERINERSEEALNHLKVESERFFLGFQKRLRQAQSESDVKIKDLKNALSDVQGRLESTKKRMYSRVEENAQFLETRVDEISAKQQEFLTQTQLFDRAELMRKSLSEDIDFLSVQMNSLERYKEDVVQLNSKISRVEKISAHVESSVSRVMREKENVEALEGKLTQTISLSENVDLNLSRLASISKALSGHQNRVEQLEEMQKNVELWCGRLEKKHQLVDSTIGGMERNFQFLQTVEEKIVEVRTELQSWEGEFEEIRKGVQLLSKQRESLDSAVKNAKNLDTLIEETEERVVQLEKSREWVAATETRMERLGQEAREQVRLLEAFSQGKARQLAGEGSAKGAPGMDTREIVLRLAHEGWKSNEIARTMKMSQGEVELIIELSPHTGK